MDPSEVCGLQDGWGVQFGSAPDLYDSCGTEITDSQKIEKTLSTFHPVAVQSSRNYRQGNYTRYSELIDVLQVVEAQDEVLKRTLSHNHLGGVLARR